MQEPLAFRGMPGCGRHSEYLLNKQTQERALCVSISWPFPWHFSLQNLLCCSSESHLSESLRSSRWWPNSTDMSYLFWHFCAIWNPVFGKFTLSFKFCFIYCHPASHSQSWCCCCGPQTEYSCPLAEFQAMRFPQLFTHLKMGERERKGETGREGDNIPVSSNFSCSPFTSFLGTPLMLLLREVLSSVSFYWNSGLFSQNAQLLTPAPWWKYVFCAFLCREEPGTWKSPTLAGRSV